MTSRRRNVYHVRLDSQHRDSDRRRNTPRAAGGWRRLKFTKLSALSRLQSHIRTLAKLSFVTFWVNSTSVEFINCLNGPTHITENIEQIFQCCMFFLEGLNFISY